MGMMAIKIGPLAVEDSPVCYQFLIFVFGDKLLVILTVGGYTVEGNEKTRRKMSLARMKTRVGGGEVRGKFFIPRRR
jgi:hypothetical protein